MRIVARTVFVAAIIAKVVVLATPAASAAPQQPSVIIKNFDYAPMSLTVRRGATVTWKNLDGEPHTVTSVDGLFRSGALDTNESYSFRFDKSGTYNYVCSIHPRMMAKVIVK
ncbi:MAG: cupredoxin family copper-binding protein [Rhizomicrobium sp.]|jgi:plastocyanin